jgi:tetratricopeptide (TPR) repeat protein
MPRYPHSVELMALSETGLVGALLLFGALFTALGAVARAVWRHRRDHQVGIACAGAAASASVYWLLHASTDWLFEVPALGGTAMALLGVALAVSARGEAAVPTSSPRRRLAGVAAAAAMVALVLSFLAPWLAASDVRAASRGWRSDPERAFRRLDRAAKLNPLSSVPDLTAGSIAVALDRLDDADREFRQARARDPRDSYALFELGAIASEQGRRNEALRLLAAARRRKPRDQIMGEALQRVRQDRRLDVSQLNDRIVEATKSRIAPG